MGVTGRLAVGVPIVATDMVPLRDLASQGVINTVQPKDVTQYFEGFMAANAIEGPNRKLMRSVFETELSLKVNAVRLEFALQSAFKKNSELSDPLKALIQEFETLLLPEEAPAKDLEVAVTESAEIDVSDTPPAS